MKWFNFFEKLYFTSACVGLCCRCNNDNNIKSPMLIIIACNYALEAWGVRKLLLDITPCTKISGFVNTSHLV